MTRVLMTSQVDTARPNPTVRMLVEALPDFVEVEGFSWRRALLSRYDVFHIHWPEDLLRSPSRIKAMTKSVLVLLLLAKLRAAGTPLLWTVHNQSPHELRHAWEPALLRTIDAATSSRVYMYRSGVPEAASNFHVIPRGDYRPLYGDRIDKAELPRGRAERLLLFGYLRPYKGVEGLLTAVAAHGAVRLAIAGEPISPEYGEELAALVEQVPGAELVPRSLSDDELADRIESSDVVVLPYKRMYNSGAALLALNFGRPIIVPASPTMLELQAEVGSEWVHTYEGELTGEVLGRLLTEIERGRRAARPAFHERDWRQVGRKYADLYTLLAARAA